MCNENKNTHLLKPNIVQATLASLFLNPPLHTVPHRPLKYISRRPDDFVPLTTRAFSGSPDDIMK